MKPPSDLDLCLAYVAFVHACLSLYIYISVGPSRSSWKLPARVEDLSCLLPVTLNPCLNRQTTHQPIRASVLQTMIAGLMSYLEALPQEAALKPVPIILASIIAAVIAVVFRISSASKLPTLNPKGTFEITDRRIKANFQKNAATLLRDWFAKNPNKPVVINGDMGPMTILPPNMANEIRNDPRLGFMEVTMEVRFRLITALHFANISS